jgi:hypothetical protein
LSDRFEGLFGAATGLRAAKRHRGFRQRGRSPQKGPIAYRLVVYRRGDPPRSESRLLTARLLISSPQGNRRLTRIRLAGKGEPAQPATATHRHRVIAAHALCDARRQPDLPDSSR